MKMIFTFLLWCDTVWVVIIIKITHITIMPLGIIMRIFPKTEKILCRFIKKYSCLSVAYNPFTPLLFKVIKYTKKSK